MADPGVTGMASIEDPLALLVKVATSGAHGTLVKVGEIDGSEIVLRVEATGGQGFTLPTDYAVYLDVQDENGEWRRLHRSVLTRRFVGAPPAIDKHE